MRNPFRYFKTSPEVIRLTVMMYVRFPLSLRQVEDLLHERDIDICHETVRTWWNRFGPMFAAGIRRRRSASMRARMQWRWHLDDGLILGIQGADECPLLAISGPSAGLQFRSALPLKADIRAIRCTGFSPRLDRQSVSWPYCLSSAKFVSSR